LQIDEATGAFFLLLAPLEIAQLTIASAFAWHRLDNKQG